LRKFVAGGGQALVVVGEGDSTTLQKLLDLPRLHVEEAGGTDFALLGELAYSHRLFAPFADPRFGDFTKIHFWKHRRAPIAETDGLKVLARFDNGDPAIVEQLLGSGSVIASTKFVPLLATLLNGRGAGDREPTQLTVGDATPGSSSAAPLERPGVYDAAGRKFAVNIAADESRTAPLEVEDLERRGAKLGSESSRQTDVERRRQLQVAELENRQKLWRWLIVAVLGLVFAETALAGTLTGKSPR
jgi:hypothetical protein